MPLNYINHVSCTVLCESDVCFVWQLTAAGRCRLWARPKPISWCNRKLHPSSSSTSGSCPESTRPHTGWTPLISTPSLSGAPAASLVRAQPTILDEYGLSANSTTFSDLLSAAPTTLNTLSSYSSPQCNIKDLILLYIILISVALNYQSEGRVLQLNRAKFYSNGNCGYILKPACMCVGLFRKYSFRQFTLDLHVLRNLSTSSQWVHQYCFVWALEQIFPTRFRCL